LQDEEYHQKHPDLFITWTEAEEQDMTLPKVESIQEQQIIVNSTAPYIITLRPHNKKL
jgi:hypothetical protein